VMGQGHKFVNLPMINWITHDQGHPILHLSQKHFQGSKFFHLSFHPVFCAKILQTMGRVWLYSHQFWLLLLQSLLSSLVSLIDHALNIMIMSPYWKPRKNFITWCL
jgi:hypothetical protein